MIVHSVHVRALLDQSIPDPDPWADLFIRGASQCLQILEAHAGIGSIFWRAFQPSTSIILLHESVNLDNKFIKSFEADAGSHLCGDMPGACSRPACKSILVRRSSVVRLAICVMYGRKDGSKYGVEIRAQKVLV